MDEFQCHPSGVGCSFERGSSHPVASADPPILCLHPINATRWVRLNYLCCTIFAYCRAGRDDDGGGAVHFKIESFIALLRLCHPRSGVRPQ